MGFCVQTHLQLVGAAVGAYVGCSVVAKGTALMPWGAVAARVGVAVGVAEGMAVGSAVGSEYHTLGAEVGAEVG